MTYMNEKLIFFSAVILLTGMSCRKANIDVHDGFESPVLSAIWSTDRMELRSFEIQSKVVRNGKSAALITLRAGDIVEAATNKDKATERDELMENSELYSIEGIKYRYQFSMFLPDTFSILPVRLVLAQWKQVLPDGSLFRIQSYCRLEVSIRKVIYHSSNGLWAPHALGDKRGSSKSVAGFYFSDSIFKNKRWRN